MNTLDFGQKYFYSMNKVSELLGVKPHIVRELHNNGMLRCAIHTGCARRQLYFQPNHIDYLVGKLATYPHALRSDGVDTVFFQLCQIEWELQSNPSASEDDHMRAKNALDVLAVSGKVMSTAALAKLIERSTRHVTYWARIGTVPCIRIGVASRGSYYVSSRYGTRIAKVFDTWYTIDEIADLAQISCVSAHRWVKEGVVKAILCPDHTWRASPESVKAEAQSAKTRSASVVNDESVLTVSQAAKILGLSPKVVTWAAQAGLVRSVRSANKRTNLRIPKSEVVIWQTRFNTLNEPFTWLSNDVSGGGKTPKTVNSKRAMQILGVSMQSVGSWSQSGLLPFYRRTFTQGAHGKEIVYRYLIGLKNFATPNKVTKNQARAYYALCKSKGMIA